jgi:hypothetical protein
MKPESNRPITIEDLLRLKRAERPPVEFWATFDRELRAKQLAALVGKRPWWQRLPGAFSLVSRYRVPIGASAVLALTFLTVRTYESPPALDVQAQPAPVALEVAPDRTESSPAVTTTLVAAVEEPAAPVDAPVIAPPQSADVAPVAIIAAKSEELPPSLPIGGVPASEADRQVQSPAVRYITANLAAIQSSEPLAGRGLLDVATGFEARAMPPRAAVEPLQQMTPPSDTRRSRLLTAMVSTASMDASMRATARAASRIEEERLYDRIHRFGARGDSLNVKF